MQKLNKKGLAGAVAVVMLMMIGITAISIVAMYYNKILENSGSQLAPAFSCLEMQTSETIKIKNACYNPQTNQTEIKIERSIKEFQIPYLDFLISSDDEESSWSCGPSCGNCVLPKTGQTKTLFFKTEKQQTEVTARISSCVLDKRKINLCNS